MSNPIKAIKGGIAQVKASNLAVKVNNTKIKQGNTVSPAGKPLTKKTLGPVNVAKAFVAGTKNPAAAKSSLQTLQTIRAGQKKG